MTWTGGFTLKEFNVSKKIKKQFPGQKHPNPQIYKWLVSYIEGTKDSNIFHNLLKKKLTHFMVINFMKRISHLLVENNQ